MATEREVELRRVEQELAFQRELNAMLKSALEAKEREVVNLQELAVYHRREIAGCLGEIQRLRDIVEEGEGTETEAEETPPTEGDSGRFSVGPEIIELSDSEESSRGSKRAREEEESSDGESSGVEALDDESSGDELFRPLRKRRGGRRTPEWARI